MSKKLLAKLKCKKSVEEMEAETADMGGIWSIETLSMWGWS